MLGYAAIASLTMLAPQRHPNHTGDAEILVIKLPQAQELINNSLLLSKAAELGNIARFVSHATEIEVATERVENSERDIGDWIR